MFKALPVHFHEVNGNGTTDFCDSCLKVVKHLFCADGQWLCIHCVLKDGKLFFVDYEENLIITLSNAFYVS